MSSEEEGGCLTTVDSSGTLPSTDSQKLSSSQSISNSHSNSTDSQNGMSYEAGYKGLPLTKETLGRHNEEMEKEFMQQHRLDKTIIHLEKYLLTFFLLFFFNQIIESFVIVVHLVIDLDNCTAGKNSKALNAVKLLLGKKAALVVVISIRTWKSFVLHLIVTRVHRLELLPAHSVSSIWCLFSYSIRYLYFFLYVTCR